jgi:hypothetical protein
MNVNKCLPNEATSAAAPYQATWAQLGPSILGPPWSQLLVISGPFGVMLGPYGLPWADVGLILGSLWLPFKPAHNIYMNESRCLGH